MTTCIRICLSRIRFMTDFVFTGSQADGGWLFLISMLFLLRATAFSCFCSSLTLSHCAWRVRSQITKKQAGQKKGLSLAPLEASPQPALPHAVP